MNLRSKRRLAASVMDVGLDRVIFDEEYSDLIQDAITRSTIRGLVGFGAIKAAPKKGTSMGRYREQVPEAQDAAAGPGSIEGSKSARNSEEGQVGHQGQGSQVEAEGGQGQGHDHARSLQAAVQAERRAARSEDVKHLLRPHEGGEEVVVRLRPAPEAEARGSHGLPVAQESGHRFAARRCSSSGSPTRTSRLSS